MYDIETLSASRSALSELAGFADAHGYRSFASDIAGGHIACPILIARSHGTVVGFIEARPRTAPYERPVWAQRAGCESWSWIHKLFVAPEHRRNAVGSRLVLEAVSEGLRAGVTFVALVEATDSLGSETRRAFFMARGLQLVHKEHGVWCGHSRYVHASTQRSLAAEDGALAPPAGRASAEPAP